MKSKTYFYYTKQIPKDLLLRNAEQYRQHTQFDQPFFETHLNKSKEIFEQSLEGVSGKALILGPGHFRDIPKPALANTFGNCTFVDIDDAGIQQWKTEYPCVEANTWVEDFTQRQASIIKKITALKYTSPTSLLAHLTTLLKSESVLPTRDRFPDVSYDFIAAPVVLSQVSYIVQSFYYKLLPPNLLEELLNSNNSYEQGLVRDFDIAHKILTTQLQQELVRWIARHLKPGGTLFLSTTPIVYEDQYKPHSQTILQTDKAVLVDILMLEKVIQPLFVAKSPAITWDWKLEPPCYENYWVQRRYIVQAQILQKKYSN